jgi:hypothetical protein
MYRHRSASQQLHLRVRLENGRNYLSEWKLEDLARFVKKLRPNDEIAVGTGTDGSPANWRCMKLEKFSRVELTAKQLLLWACRRQA